ncbi:uncharacterized protein LOC124672029 [Lolium rigidum]|uniref:uncharacterized protein LOC124655185 n=1 Tax=Lolium rigidum TaxID=89674 RepID=UPI001F5D4F96|nr:uncharacterized protein LOC124655185 [Lolium rigidum]XP_047050100.1 uncharacterized protein LOC124655208 [Lolium rigidum]XP_047064282.1 uncharacterized protein LOC124672029 [Lolium rigidum]
MELKRWYSSGIGESMENPPSTISFSHISTTTPITRPVSPLPPFMSCSVLPPRVDLNAWSRREGPSTATLSSKFGCSLTSATKGRLEHVYVRLKCCFSMVAAMKQVFCRRWRSVITCNFTSKQAGRQWPLVGVHGKVVGGGGAKLGYREAASEEKT